MFIFAYQIVDFKFRLVGGRVPYAGRVEVLYGGVWGDVDNYGWDLNAGHVICRYSGYQAGALTAVTRSLGIFSGSAFVKWMDNIRCRGNESSLDDCQFELETRMTSGRMNGGVVCNTGNNTGSPLFQLFIPFVKKSIFIVVLYTDVPCGTRGPLSKDEKESEPLERGCIGTCPVPEHAVISPNSVHAVTMPCIVIHVQSLFYPIRKVV